MPLDVDPTLLAGLRELSESAFPKRCATCGRAFASVAEYVLETDRVRADITGLKQSTDEDGSHIVELFRNCPCGSTLMDVFADRRNTAEAGLQRRKRFGELLAYLVSSGLQAVVARDELLKVMRGEASPLLRSIAPPKST